MTAFNEATPPTLKADLLTPLLAANPFFDAQRFAFSSITNMIGGTERRAATRLCWQKGLKTWSDLRSGRLHYSR
jgi:hypothetical protein